MAYQSAAALRGAVSVLADTTKFPDVVLTDLVSEFEKIAEDYRGAAFETRTVTGEEHLVTRPRRTLGLGNVFVRTVTSLTVDGTSMTGGGADYYIDKAPGIIRFVAGLTGTNQTVLVSYTHSISTTATAYPQLIRACREYVRSCALSDRSGVPRDVIAQSLDGGYTRYSTPDKDAGRPTGWLEVDRLLNSIPDYRIGVG